MKKIIFIFLLFVSNALILSASDNYSGKSIVRARRTKYSISKTVGKNITFVDITNVKNVLNEEYPIDLATGESYTFANNPMPLIDISCEELDDVIHSVFNHSDFNKYFKDSCRILATFRIDPSTKSILEIKFCLYYEGSDTSILSLPIRKIEKLEKELKSADLFPRIPAGGENASFLIWSARIL